MIVNELLYFVQNKFGCKSFSVLQEILVNFFSENGICNANKMLHDFSVRVLDDKALSKLKI